MVFQLHDSLIFAFALGVKLAIIFDKLFSSGSSQEDLTLVQQLISKYGRLLQGQFWPNKRAN